MKLREPVKARQILIPLGVGLAFALGVLLTDGFPGIGTEEFWKKLCDAFTVPGILLTGAGLLAEVSARGAFDGIGFPVRKAFGQILPQEKREAMPKTYFDYVAARQGKAKNRSGATLRIGLVFLAGAGICLAVYLLRYSG